MLEFGGRCPFRGPLLPAFLSCLLLSWTAPACECYWVGPFLTVAPRAETIVRGRVLAYHPGESGPAPLQAMDVEILDVWKGEVPSPILRVWGDNGGLCRPDVTQFPLRTEWLLALNGPGSKPGMSPGPAISVCGTYWLEVRGGMARGNVDVAGEMTAAQELPLAEVRRRLAAACAQQEPEPGPALPARGTERREQPAAAGPTGIPPSSKAQIAFAGEVRAGESYERPFGPGLSFRLEPSKLGWSIVVREKGCDEDLARLTPPLHFVPNPREIEGWHFRNADNSGPNEPGERNVNVPGMLREFIFSPEVGRAIDGPGTTTSLSPQDIERVRRFGEGRLEILEYRLGSLEPGRQAAVEWMRFRVQLAWLDAAAMEDGGFGTAVEGESGPAPLPGQSQGPLE